ncbi:uncharacterized protein LOC136718716 isoform X2 [Amia ocellicauda]|uniref:uncharacterized protein LOC136718716 isoform X2 n=1 Tax=Amia ocellicauda TaxID=2972642 RepID=UPI0034645813
MTARPPGRHQKSTLPSILEAYLPADHKKQTDAKQSKKKDRRDEAGFVKNSHIGEEDEEAKVLKQAMLDQRHLEAYKNVHRLRDTLHRHYTNLLQEKVHRQRQQMQQRTVSVQRPPEKDAGQSVSVSVRRLASSTLCHDDQYLQSLPKSSYYLIIDLQNHLTSCGFLKTRQDQEEFWKLVQQHRHSAQLRARLQDVKMRMTGYRSAPSFTLRTSAEDALGQPNTIHLGHMEESLQNALSESGDACESSPHHPSKQKKEDDEIEQMFPKLKVPKFITLQPGFVKQCKALHEHKIPEPLQRSKTREVNLGKLHLMYSLSLSNMASTQRLLDRNGQFTDFREESNAHNLRHYLFPSESGLKGEQFLPRLCPALLPAPSVASPLAPAGLPQHDTAPANVRPTAAGSSVVESERGPSQSPDPLTMEEVRLRNPVKEVKRPDKLWMNYVRDASSKPTLMIKSVHCDHDTG